MYVFALSEIEPSYGEQWTHKVKLYRLSVPSGNHYAAKCSSDCQYVFAAIGIYVLCWIIKFCFQTEWVLWIFSHHKEKWYKPLQNREHIHPKLPQGFDF